MTKILNGLPQQPQTFQFTALLTERAAMNLLFCAAHLRLSLIIWVANALRDVVGVKSTLLVVIHTALKFPTERLTPFPIRLTTENEMR
jgi:hypothetical protein